MKFEETTLNYWTGLMASVYGTPNVVALLEALLRSLCPIRPTHDPFNQTPVHRCQSVASYNAFYGDVNRCAFCGSRGNHWHSCPCVVQAHAPCHCHDCTTSRAKVGNNMGNL